MTATASWLLDRAVLIDICKDGTLSHRVRGDKNAKRLNGSALPVFSVDNVADAESLKVHFGKRQYIEHPERPGEPWMKLFPFGGELEELDRVCIMFSQWYDGVLARRPPIEGSRWLHKGCRRTCVVVSSTNASVVYRYERAAGATSVARDRSTPPQMLLLEQWRALFREPATAESDHAMKISRRPRRRSRP